MENIFSLRHALKSKIHSRFKDKEFLTSFFVDQREIWYCYLGANVGYEENGKGKEFRRPVLILKKVGILYFVVPLTTHPKEDNRFYHVFGDGTVEYFVDTASRKKSGVILSQVRVIDKTRCIYKMGLLQQDEFAKVTKKLKTLLF